MKRYLARRVGQAIVVVIGVTMLAFFLQSLIATGPALARILIGGRAGFRRSGPLCMSMG